MENARNTHGELRELYELFKAWLANPFGVAVSFLAAVAIDDERADAR